MLAELDELAREAERIGTQAEELERGRRELPAQLEAAKAACEEAEAAAEDRQGIVSRVESTLTEAEQRGDGDRVVAIRRDATRAHDHARMAEQRLNAARAEEQRLSDEADRAERDRSDLVERAREIARALRERPGLTDQAGLEPADDLAELGRWTTEARAALFVARGQLATQREQLIRQANELGAAVLGEPLSASSAAVVARRVESR